jgi:ABC-type polysaccharide/polyol phosphate transport system ATPase subunit
VEFSGIRPFIDQPVKTYSSGMYVRLGFAVAVHVDPDVLLIDEVLAVGDAAFQAKCFDRILEFRRRGKTILCVSHAPAMVQKLCDRAIWLDHGDLMLDGPLREVADSYEGRLRAGHGS